MTENDPVLYGGHRDPGVMSSALKMNAYNNLRDDFHYTLKMKVVAKITIFDVEGESCFSRRRKSENQIAPDSYLCGAVWDESELDCSSLAIATR
ncbi:hypothetical protein IVB14_13705 [Bradyrhizobium sp. 180]|uniref:hypothetical protein n=1 Tax=unclassified Bradyrhizobium TaxID=2631580 RepID=UPI001FF96D4B|nr:MULTISPECIES: hypothetical protein [unclassified Bradyrhizobium]MCK1420771.1 hypothetical protein [Bradyrhizobium sp. CW12]MCK1491442.1 hypothetical protein [Bradyrhizobium sp. 180]MCK1527214.1 hypothetical protein [Bradyrhizobium sp. 182]MCK1596017.1 hypothetical protein [Bradyrhizobium sp. 164]MCK1648798.1 hypothetical protein [Bradyrhizobium sp. 154]